MKFRTTPGRHRHRRPVLQGQRQHRHPRRHLWSSTGTQLATVTFTGETATGWQQATLRHAGGDHRQHHLRRRRTTPRGHYAVTRELLRHRRRPPAARCTALQQRNRRRQRRLPLRHRAASPSIVVPVQQLLGRRGLHRRPAATGRDHRRRFAINEGHHAAAHAVSHANAAAGRPAGRRPGRADCWRQPPEPRPPRPPARARSSPQPRRPGQPGRTATPPRRARREVPRRPGRLHHRHPVLQGHRQHRYATSGPCGPPPAPGWPPSRSPARPPPAGSRPVRHARSPITANTTYVVSYYAPVGRYSADESYFAGSGVDNSPLTALANGADGGNGVYRYGTGGGFPSSTLPVDQLLGRRRVRPPALPTPPSRR